MQLLWMIFVNLEMVFFSLLATQQLQTIFVYIVHLLVWLSCKFDEPLMAGIFVIFFNMEHG